MKNRWQNPAYQTKTCRIIQGGELTERSCFVHDIEGKNKRQVEFHNQGSPRKTEK